MVDVFVVIAGLVVGIFSGLIGVGGGILIVPALVLGLGFTQHRAQGTSLAALLLPVGIFSCWQYHKAGNLDVKVALLLAVGIAAGGYFGGMWAQQISPLALRRCFAMVMLLVAVKLLVQK